MANVLDGKQAIRNLLHVPCGPPKEKDFKAVMLVQVDMDCGDDIQVIAVLDFIEAVRYLAHLVAVNKGQGADYLGAGI